MERAEPSASERGESSGEPRHPRSAAPTARPEPPQVPSVAIRRRMRSPSFSVACSQVCDARSGSRSISGSSNPQSSKGLSPTPFLASSCVVDAEKLLFAPRACPSECRALDPSFRRGLPPACCRAPLIVGTRPPEVDRQRPRWNHEAGQSGARVRAELRHAAPFPRHGYADRRDAPRHPAGRPEGC